MKKRHKKRLKKIIEQLKHAKTKEEIIACVKLLEILYADLEEVHNDLNNNSIGLLRFTLTEILKNMDLAINHLTGKGVRAKKKVFDLSDSDYIEKSFKPALIYLNKALRTEPSSEKMQAMRMSTLLNIIIGILSIIPSLVLPVLINAKYFGIQGKYINWSSAFDFTNDIYNAVFYAILLTIGCTILVYIYYLFELIVSYKFNYNNSNWYTYTATKLISLAVCIVVVYLLYPNQPGSILVYKNIPLSFFGWWMFGLLLESPLILYASCKTYFDMCKTDIGWIILRPVNILFYPLNCLLDKIFIKSYNSMRFYYYPDRGSSERAGIKHSYEYEAQKENYTQYYEKTEWHTASGTAYVQGEGEVPVDVEYKTKSYVPVEKTRTNYVRRDYSQTGYHRSNFGTCKSLSTRKILKYFNTRFVGTGAKQYKN